ncbi:retinoid-inducible serine carboxypeptidase precursor [Zea mays]|uniref:Carboxypeptidase n=2 Tax=Zea mays TaxID=4577 RepID=B6SYG2_MAIZE|nr:retinoid-inducible serine carboxypeptidase precursor [Zea mays]ACG29895.1 retinoid-inducible serine carboxypeptidase precursor [Zea mays]ACL52510.1 unknown [Zea mays]ACL52533.1 unknown [Zea mays]AQK51581.1 Retinoid-inducible serine carboxypeptidase, mRNA [Zea mays]|eukprot:NP_001148149.1 retinoid-inducible serine carboxypeptidase precursor [Zea mays]
MASSRGPLAALLLLAACAAFFPAAGAAGTPDGSEEWGYVEVRPKAHMFWWLYHSPQRVDNGKTPWPTVLWLQGGPGASGVGYGNFMEIGPLDEKLKPRATTWLAKADLLFVDNPVGTGFSYVDGGDKSLMAHTDAEAARDLVTLLCALYRDSPRLRASPLYIVAESYGGKFAVTTALAALRAVDQGRLGVHLAGVALGDSWISPLDFVLSWGPLLYQVSRVDEKGLQQCNSVAAKIKEQLEKGQFADAEASWSELEGVVLASSNSVNFYNFLKDEASGDATATATAAVSTLASFRRRGGYSGYLSSMAASSSSSAGGFDGLMNTVIKKKLGIIPKDLKWGEQSDDVFDALAGDFMKPRIQEVDQLLKLGVNVTIYSGQLDLICATKGTMDWVQKLKWDDLNSFLSSPRTPIYCDKEGQSGTQAFVKSYKNLNFYWILEAGHMVPLDNPCPALKMLADITRSPAE